MEKGKAKNISDLYRLLFRSGPAARMVNLITLYRIVTAPILVVLIYTGQINIFKWLLLASFTTDAIDGYLARRFKANSVLGAKLDSIGDDLTVLVAMIGVFVYLPEFILEQAFIIAGVLGLLFIQIVFSLIRYKKVSSFHTYLAKIAAVLQGGFLLSMFFFENTFYLLFYAASLVTALELIEEIILIAILPKWENDVKGLLWVLKRKV